MIVALTLVALRREGCHRAPSRVRAARARPPRRCRRRVRAVPGADRAPAYARWTPGLRFAFFSTNAVTQSDPGKMGMRRDPNGKIRDTKGGTWTLTKPVGGSGGGVGYTVVDVVAADAGGLVLDQRLYFLPQGERGPAVFTGSSGLRVPPAGGDFFVHPALLAKVEPSDDEGAHVIHEQFERAGRTHKALRFTANTAGYFSRVYDLESGVLLSETYAYKASQGSFHDDDRHIREATVRTSGTHTFVSARTTSFPWLRGAMPAWVATTRRLVYRGSVVSRAPGFPDGSAGVTATYTLRDVGASHALYDVSPPTRRATPPAGDSPDRDPVRAAPSASGEENRRARSAGTVWIDPASRAPAKLEPWPRARRGPGARRADARRRRRPTPRRPRRRDDHGRSGATAHRTPLRRGAGAAVVRDRDRTDPGDEPHAYHAPRPRRRGVTRVDGPRVPGT